MSSNYSNKDRISKILAKRYGLSSLEYRDKVDYISEGTYTRVYRYQNSAFKVDKDRDIFAKSNITKSTYVDENILKELIGSIGILPHPNLVRVIDIHHDMHGIITEMEMMDSDLRNSKIPDQINEEIFTQILESMLDGVEHMHSFGFLHGDIKPSNILVKTVEGHSRFALCDMNLVQYIPYTGYDPKYTLFGTKHFIPAEKTEYRSFGIDIYMIGASLADIVLGYGELNAITPQLVRINKDKIIKKVGKTNYQIICLMLERLPSRPYIHHIREYLRPNSATPFEIYAEQGRDLMITDEEIIPKKYRYDEITLSNYTTNGYCTPRYMFEEGLRYYQKIVHGRLGQVYPKIESMFSPLTDDRPDLDSNTDVKRVLKFRNYLGVLNYNFYTLNTIDCIFEQIRDMGIDVSPAMYIAQSLVLFPNAFDPSEWMSTYLASSKQRFNSQITELINRLGQKRGDKINNICLTPSIDQHIGFQPPVVSIKTKIEPVEQLPPDDEGKYHEYYEEEIDHSLSDEISMNSDDETNDLYDTDSDETITDTDIVDNEGKGRCRLRRTPF
jgi:serine/threonine protein kinase